ncbi:hypothetical protein HNV08_09565 [Winogradskyella eckloniae]|uniref:hypothetical protein n=1 Tax=Winogradskyella eckloniae TaxID=1089306 RepID=UPI001563D71B|nr:hypothetical protein [Winogradskyella eckloniae]NRD20293.1 hypothetical protein [Winogradskyella eckloniae]
MKKINFLVSFLLLFVIGFLCYPSFFETLISIVDLHQVELASTAISSRFKTQLVFAIILSGITPIYYIIQKLTKINFWFDGVYVLIFIIIFGGLTSILRAVYIFQELELLSRVKFNEGVKMSYHIDSFNFEYYLLLGFVIGAIICFGLLRIKQKRKD